MGLANLLLAIKNGAVADKNVVYVNDGSGNHVPANCVKDSNGLLVDPATLDGQLVTRRTRLVASSTTITRPANATQYAAGDLWANDAATPANNTLANSVFQFAAASANDAPFLIKSAYLKKSSNTVLGASFWLHFFNVNPYATAPAVGDNGLFDQALAAAAIAGYLGALEVTMTLRGATTCGGWAYPTKGDFIEAVPVAGGTAVYAIPEVRNSLTPTASDILSCSIRVAG